MNDVTRFPTHSENQSVMSERGGLTFGYPIDFNADVPIFPPAAFAMATLCSVVLAVYVRRFRFLPPALATTTTRLAVLFALVSSAVWDVRTSQSRLEEAGSGVLFVEPKGLTQDFPFSVIRNPMYAGLLTLSAMSSIVVDSLWPLVFVPILWAYFHFVVVAAEEELLLAIHGDEYREYQRAVPRWGFV